MERGEEERNGEREEKSKSKREQKSKKGQAAPFRVSGIPGCCQVTVRQSLDRMLTFSSGSNT